MARSLEAPLSSRSVHLCIDMQRLFSEDGPWPTPWMPRVLPKVARVAERFPERTIFTRFIPPQRPEDLSGTWHRYYEKWRDTTRDRLDPALLELMPELARLTPPALTLDKAFYSAFSATSLAAGLRQRGVDALIVTGSETDVCVLATVLGAVDRGFRTVLVTDCVCSSSDEGHDALLDLYQRRYSQQIETADSEMILENWPA